MMSRVVEMRCRRRSLQCTQVLKRWVRKQGKKIRTYDRSIDLNPASPCTPSSLNFLTNLKPLPIELKLRLDTPSAQKKISESTWNPRPGISYQSASIDRSIDPRATLCSELSTERDGEPEEPKERYDREMKSEKIRNKKNRKGRRNENSRQTRDIEERREKREIFG